MGRLLLGDRTDAPTATPPRLRPRLLDRTNVRAGPHRPESVDERQAGPVVPLLTEIKGVLEARQARAHCTVAGEQHRVGVTTLGVVVQRQRDHLGIDAVALAKKYL